MSGGRGRSAGLPACRAGPPREGRAGEPRGSGRAGLKAPGPRPRWRRAARGLLAAALGLAGQVNADEGSAHWSFGLAADIYYGVDANDPASGRRPAFLFNHTRTGRPALNLGLLSLSARDPRWRFNLGLMTGTYPEENLAQEPDWAQHVFQANVGIALDARGTVWLDLGILPSHIGFESAISSDNPTLTRSLAAENSPYYLTGARLGWDVNARWSVAALLLTGWQRTQPVDGNSLPSFGTQVVFRPHAGLSLNWSTFIGTDDPDESRRMRYFSNVYVQAALAPGLELTAGFDLGLQQTARNASGHAAWFTPTVILRRQLSQHWFTALRAEYYQDVDEVIVSTADGRGIRTWGVSWNLDWQASPSVLCRLETRHLQDRMPIFETDGARLDDQSTAFLASVAIAF